MAAGSVLPVPGRHAARRRSARSGLVSGAQEAVRDRVRLTPAHLSLIAVLVAVGVMVTAYWVVRGADTGRPVDTADASAVQTLAAGDGASSSPDAGTSDTGVAGAGSESSGTAAAAAAAAGAGGGSVVVDVAGKVRRPGIVELRAGSRVADALERAGGALPGVRLISLNLARPLVDGEQVLVGIAPPAGVAAGAGPAEGVAGAPDTASDGDLVNLNTAELTELDTLPGVGPVTGQAILDWRQENGSFTSVEELLEVSGIGDKTLAELAPLVTV